MSLDNALGIASSGLAAVQRALAQTAQNVSNANTPGYTRKTIAETAIVLGDSPAGVRSGVAQRAVDAALVQQLNSSSADAAAAGVREQLLQGIEQAYGGVSDPAATGGSTGSTSLADDLGALQSGFLALRDSPDDAGQQRTVRDAAGQVAADLNRVGAAIGAARQQAQDGTVTEVAAVNAGLRQIGTLTRQIQLAAQSGASTAALEDQRDLAIGKLSESLPVKPIRQPDGGLTLLAGGLVLPTDPNRDALTTGGASLGPSAWHGAGGTLPDITLGGVDVTASLSGGRLGAYVTLRDATLPRFQAEADTAAAQLAARLDQQGLRLFTDAAGTVPDTSQPYNAPAGGQLGFANTIRVSAAVSANPALLRDGTQAVAGAPGGPTAFTPNPSGGPAGFTTLIDRVVNYGLGSAAAAGAAWPAIANIGLGPDGSLGSAFLPPPGILGYVNQVQASHTGERAAASSAKTAAGDLVASLQQRFNAQSGVSTDTEMSNLVSLQNAYAANAKVLTTVQQMWDSLLNAVA
jgi:flagellar hook-associated protein 1 FlgK